MMMVNPAAENNYSGGSETAFYLTQTIVRGESIKKIFYSLHYNQFVIIKDRSIDTVRLASSSAATSNSATTEHTSIDNPASQQQSTSNHHSQQYVFGTIFDAVLWNDRYLFVVSDSGHVSKLSYSRERERWENEFNVWVAKPGFHSESPINVLVNERDGSFMVIFLEQVIQYWLHNVKTGNTKTTGTLTKLGQILCAAFVDPFALRGGEKNGAVVSEVTGSSPLDIVVAVDDGPPPPPPVRSSSISSSTSLSREGKRRGSSSSNSKIPLNEADQASPTITTADSPSRYKIMFFKCLAGLDRTFTLPLAAGDPRFIRSMPGGFVFCLTENFYLFTWHRSFEHGYQVKLIRRLDYRKKSEFPTCFMVYQLDSLNFLFLYSSSASYLYEMVIPVNTLMASDIGGDSEASLPLPAADYVQLKKIAIEVQYFPEMSKIALIFDSGPAKIFKYVPGLSIGKRYLLEKRSSLQYSFPNHLVITDNCSVPLSSQRRGHNPSAVMDDQLLLSDYNDGLYLLTKGFKFSETFKFDISSLGSKAISMIKKILFAASSASGTDILLALCGSNFSFAIGSSGNSEDLEPGAPPELVEFGDSINQFSANEETVLISPIGSDPSFCPHLIVQGHQILIHSMEKKEMKCLLSISRNDKRSIKFAHHFGNLLVTLSVTTGEEEGKEETSNQTSISCFRIAEDLASIKELENGTFHIPGEITCSSAVIYRNEQGDDQRVIRLAIGTIGAPCAQHHGDASTTLACYEISHSLGILKEISHLSLGPFNGTNVIHSLALLYPNVIVAGIRDGSISVFRINKSNEVSAYFQLMERIPVGVRAPTIIYQGGYYSGMVIINSDAIWLLKLQRLDDANSVDDEKNFDGNDSLLEFTCLLQPINLDFNILQEIPSDQILLVEAASLPTNVVANPVLFILHSSPPFATLASPSSSSSDMRMIGAKSYRKPIATNNFYLSVFEIQSSNTSSSFGQSAGSFTQLAAGCANHRLEHIYPVHQAKRIVFDAKNASFFLSRLELQVQMSNQNHHRNRASSLQGAQQADNNANNNTEKGLGKDASSSMSSLSSSVSNLNSEPDASSMNKIGSGEMSNNSNLPSSLIANSNNGGGDFNANSASNAQAAKNNNVLTNVLMRKSFIRSISIRETAASFQPSADDTQFCEQSISNNRMFSLLKDNSNNAVSTMEFENSKDTTALCIWNIKPHDVGKNGDIGTVSLLCVGSGTPFAKIPRAKLSLYQIVSSSSALTLKKVFELSSFENCTAITCVKTFLGFLLVSFNNSLNLYEYSSSSSASSEMIIDNATNNNSTSPPPGNNSHHRHRPRGLEPSSTLGSSFTLKLVTSYQTRYPINKFGCQGNRVVLGLQRDVIHLLEYDLNLKKFKVIASDDEVHNCSDIKALSPNLFLGVDRWGECFVTRLQHERNGVHRLKTLLTCQLGESANSVKILSVHVRPFTQREGDDCKVEWIVESIQQGECKDQPDPNVTNDEDENAMNTCENPLFNYNQLLNVSTAAISTLSGSIFRMMRIKEPVFRKLKALESILSRQVTTISTAGNSIKVPNSSATSNPQNSASSSHPGFGRPLLGHSYIHFRGRYRVNHVDGDMIQQFLMLTPSEQDKVIEQVNYSLSTSSSTSGSGIISTRKTEIKALLYYLYNI